MKNEKPSEKLVPAQEQGGKSDTSSSTTMDSEQDAMELFDMAKNRLLDICNWQKLCGPLSGKFQLTDPQGNETGGLAQVGHYLKINLPVPGTETGDGYDWVRIEAIEEATPEPGNEEIVMKVRPAPSPTNADDNTAHFFKDAATSTFMVKRQHNTVTAEVHGRNELPNDEQDKAFDKVRNVVTAIGAILGFSSSQWKLLVTGLVSVKKLR